MVHCILMPIDDRDWDEVMEVQFRAFSKERFCELVRGGNTIENRAKCKEQYADQRTKQREVIWLKAISASDPRKKILGVAKYTICATYIPRTPVDIDPSSFVWLEDPEDRDIAALILQDVVDRLARHIKGPHILLGSLFVDPEYRGQGIATRLVKWGVGLADHMMLPVWLEASTTAHSLYVRQGFHEKIRCRLTMGKWDIEYSIMKKSPKTTHFELDEAHTGIKQNGC
ncbi:hypothetical protein D8B26_002884 [Coccidioides posadasii str. Silveira]|uniref:Uncharacterized protein n=1 Tax=Coccidioides posadasii (strain RMSCC 757 / Silveira) TaxID=443226 RepID=E9CXX3_COCPS|nr:conserved hypothetical protein [Coccidioides posadasii str. Silveira]QVM08191.1 hypothetical protein D8B26_002884 [Coccidioides posadasii str. Silveira]